MNEMPSSLQQSAASLPTTTRRGIERRATSNTSTSTSIIPANELHSHDDESDDGDDEGTAFYQKHAAPSSTSSSGSQYGDQSFTSRKRRKLDASNNDNHVAKNSERVIDLTSTPHQHQIRDILSIQNQEGQAVISLLDSSDDDDVDCSYGTKPSAIQHELEAQDNTSRSSERETNKKSYGEISHIERAIIEIIDEETDLLPFTAARSLPLQITNSPLNVNTSVILPSSNNTATTESTARDRVGDGEPLFQDFVNGDLSHQNKEDIYVDARRPAQSLKKGLDHLYDQLRGIGSYNSKNDRRLSHNNAADREASSICHNESDRLKAHLKTAQRNAAQDIFNRNNSAGGMGNMDANNGNLSVDFHGLYVKEAIAKFQEIVVPILPVQREVVIITGKGNHSRNGKSKLRDGLVVHIRQTDEFKKNKIRYEVNPSNRGQLIVRSL